MTFVLRTVVAVSAGGIVALSLNASARPTPAAIPILVAALVFAGIALFAIEFAKGRKSDGGEGEAQPEEAKLPSGGGAVLARPIEVSGTIASVTRLSSGVSRVLPGIGEKVKVTLIGAGGRLTIYMEFGARWAGALGEFRRGDLLEGSGWVKKADAHSVHLVDCALVGHGSA
jgi:hypothetical protein